MNDNTSCSGLGLRVASAFILAPLTILAIAWGGIPFLICMAVAFIISEKEWCAMMMPHPRPWLYVAAGSIYLAFCFLSFIVLRMNVPFGAYWALGLIMAIWASDSGAYFIGKAIGGPKLAPSISPKKTWAGFAGAVIFAGIAMFLIYYLFFSHHALFRAGHVSGRPLRFFIAGALVGAVGQAGDLLESLFKRRAGVKDTGNLIPGHGGLLDRIDSLLLTAPLFLVMACAWLK